MMASRSTQRRHEKNREAVRAFTHGPGTPVRVIRANGEALNTVLTSYAFLLDGCHALVHVEGIPGNVRLSRVKIASREKGEG